MLNSTLSLVKEGLKSLQKKICKNRTYYQGGRNAFSYHAQRDKMKAG